MGRLKDFLSYLEDRRDATRRIGQQLMELLSKYETFFAEVSRVRDEELVQLTRHIVADRTALPDDLDAALREAEAEVDAELDGKLAALKAQLKAQRDKAESLRARSLAAEREVRQRNVALDGEEEQLKARTAELLAQIDEHNRRIRELSRGLGFFANIFQMRPLAERRRALLREHDDLVVRIEVLRERWRSEESEHAERETDLRQQWIAERTKQAALEAKLDHLTEIGPRIRLRSTVERVLFARQPRLAAPRPGDPPCSRCRSPNPESHHFCAICAQRLVGDRPDLQGSLLEIAELNLHHQRFAEGMQACQELLGLVKGLHSGIEAFMKSVRDVMASEDRYPLPKLKIDVPKASAQFGAHFDELERWVGDQAKLSLHPRVFAKTIAEQVMAAFSEQNIKLYFETMGSELSRQAKAQW